MGAMQGEFGVGFDYRLGNSFKLYSQVYDFNDTKVKVGGELKLTDNLSLLLSRLMCVMATKTTRRSDCAVIFKKRFDFWVIKKYNFLY